MNQKGFSLIELLITMIIGIIAILAAAGPFVAERTFWVSGRSQAEAQRDGQVVLRTMANVARESTGYTIVNIPGQPSIAFNTDCGTITFQGGPNFNSGRLDRTESLTCGGNSVAVIDGNRSEVTSLAFNGIGNRLVRIQMEVTHEGRENEILQTELYLRNAS